VIAKAASNAIGDPGTPVIGRRPWLCLIGKESRFHRIGLRFFLFGGLF
jgi:hypothetical protein